jgi:hypothetical protein
MSHLIDDSLIEFRPDTSDPVRPPWHAAGAAGWTIAGMVGAAAAWTVVVLVHRANSALPNWDIALNEPAIPLAITLALFGWACGFAVGGLAGLLFGSPSRIAAGLTRGFGWAFFAALAAGLGPLLAFVAIPTLPPAVGFGLAPVLAGAAAGFVGYTWGRRAEGTSRAGSVRVAGRLIAWRTFAGAAVWGFCGAVAGAAGWVAAMVASRQFLEPYDLVAIVEDGVRRAILVAAGVGSVSGFLTGAIAGLVLGRPHRLLAFGTWAIVGAAIGAIGGALGPVLLRAGWGLTPETAGAAAWAVAGLLAGPAGYAWTRWFRPGRCESRRARGDTYRSNSHAVSSRPSGRLLPVWAVAIACVAVFLAIPGPPVGWPMLAIGLLGLAVAWALTGQDRRIRELEREIRVRDATIERDA